MRDNVRHRHDIEEAYLRAFARAHREVVIANAYFLPGQRFLKALCDAARRGVRVTLLLQGRVEYVLVHYASRALYRELLDAGVQIHEYTRSFLHAKVAVVDDSWATVGSSNIDPVSLLLARESNVVVRDRRFVRELRGSLMDAIEAGARPGAARTLGAYGTDNADGYRGRLCPAAATDRHFELRPRAGFSLKRRRVFDLQFLSRVCGGR